MLAPQVWGADLAVEKSADVASIVASKINISKATELKRRLIASPVSPALKTFN